MKLGLLQLEIEGGDVETNLDRALAGIEDAARRDVDLLALPELWNVGFFAFDQYESAAEPIDGPTLSRIAEAAAAHSMGILAGSVVEDLGESPVETPAEDGLSNTAVLFDGEGSRLAHYRKHHLFGYESEEATRLTPGNSLGVAEFEGFTVGITTCYDLRFPRLYERLLDAGVDLLLVPSAWPYPRVEHWNLLTRARAVENLAYLGAVNGVGSFDDASLVGRSAIIDPWGTTLAGTGDDPDMLVADIQPDHVATIREEFPALRDRRSDGYP